MFFPMNIHVIILSRLLTTTPHIQSLIRLTRHTLQVAGATKTSQSTVVGKEDEEMELTGIPERQVGDEDVTSADQSPRKKS